MDILRIKNILRERGRTSKDLAHELGITENALSMIANGKRQPRFELMLSIAQALDVDIRELFHSTKEDQPETMEDAMRKIKELADSALEGEKQ